MKKLMVYTNILKIAGHLIIILLLATAVGVIGLTAYNEGYLNGEQSGSLYTAQYVAQKCHNGSKLELFGKTYYCGELQSL